MKQIEDILGPRQQNPNEILINSLGALISGIIGSVIILIIIFSISGVLDVPSKFAEAKTGAGASGIFPFILSIITFLGTTITVFMTYYFLTLTDPDKYKRNIIQFSQIAFFTFITYILMTPLYIYTGGHSYENIMYIFIAHTTILTFGVYIILEILNNYRYILPGIYGSFFGLLITTYITINIFFSITSGKAKLIILLILLPLINTSIIFFKQLFEYLYYQYYKFTGLDQLGDIFRQIELEEMEELQKAEQQNFNT